MTYADPFNSTLTWLFIAGAILGALLSIFLMQLKGVSQSATLDPLWLRRLRRAELCFLALAFLGAARFVVSTDYSSPWWPNVVLVWTMNASLVVNIVTVYVRQPSIMNLIKAGLIHANDRRRARRV